MIYNLHINGLFKQSAKIAVLNYSFVAFGPKV
jgi:hypothetical protein